MTPQERRKLERFAALVRDVQIKLLAASTFGPEDSSDSALLRIGPLRKHMAEFENELSKDGPSASTNLSDGWQIMRDTLAESCRLALEQLEKRL